MQPDTQKLNNSSGQFMDAVLNHWPVAMVVISIIFSWAYFQTDLADITKQIADQETRISSVESSNQEANVNYATLSGKIDTVNANITILLKANHLQ